MYYYHKERTYIFFACSCHNSVIYYVLVTHLWVTRYLPVIYHVLVTYLWMTGIYQSHKWPWRMNLIPVHCGSLEGYCLAQETWLMCRRIQYLYVFDHLPSYGAAVRDSMFLGQNNKNSHNAIHNYMHMHFHFIILWSLP